MPDSPSQKGQGHGGGPNTPEGKAISSQNAAKHYLCSRQLIAPGELEEEFQQLQAGWFASYDTSSFAAHTLIQNLAQCDWMRRRANFQYDLLLNSLPENLQDWDEHQRAEHMRYTRYKTTADRAFSRAYREAEQFRRSRRTEALQDRAEARRQLADQALRQKEEAARQKLEAERKASEPVPPKPKSLLGFSQWINITIVDGKTHSRIHPTNRHTLLALANADPATPVFRFFDFPDGVPPEYEWITADPVKRQTKGWQFDQKMTLAIWRLAAQRENEHLGPIADLVEPKGDLETEPEA